MIRGFSARWGGKCGECGEWIHLGDEARFEDDVLVHVECGTGPDPLQARPTCPVCNLTRPCYCEEATP